MQREEEAVGRAHWEEEAVEVRLEEGEVEQALLVESRHHRRRT